MKFLKDNNWFCLTLGFNIQEGYAEDRELLRVAGLAHKHGINVHLNIIVKGAEDGKSTYYLDTVGRLLFRYLPESMELYFWTPYPGTRSFAQYRDSSPLRIQDDERPQFQVRQPAAAGSARKSPAGPANKLL